MSNPGVIYLSSTKTKRNESFRLEDNIGEAIHLHYENFRIDLSTSEFLNLSETIEKSIEKLINIPNFDITNYDPFFLKQISKYLIDLEVVRFEEVSLSTLKIIRKNFLGLSVVDKLSNSRVVKALNGNSKENDFYNQENFYNQTNQERIDAVKKKIINDGYPYNNEYIVLFNNQNLIRDGQHRASVMLNSGKYDKITIIRLIFKNNNYNLSLHPWIRELLSPLKKNIKKTYTLFKKIVNKLKTL